MTKLVAFWCLIGCAVGIILSMATMLAAAPVVPAPQPHTVNGYLVVAVCGTLGTPYVAGAVAAATIDVNGQFCVNK